MDTKTMIAALDFTRNRLLGTLDTIEKTATEKSLDVQKVMGWRPGPGRAHIAWQAAHCAATHDKYVNVTLLGHAAKNPALVADFGGGSTPSDTYVPALADIRKKLSGAFTDFKAHIHSLDDAGLARSIPGPNNTQRTVVEAILLLTWHEAHHQGQIHLTWNLYKAALGIG